MFSHERKVPVTIGLEKGVVRLVPYQPSWKRYYEEEVERLRAAMKEKLLEIEHCGSTAIVGLVAKPIIDIAATVRSIHDPHQFIPLLESLRYEYMEKDTVSGRLFFIQSTPDDKSLCHLSLTEPLSDFWYDQILFRNFLRSHPETQQEYSQLKQELAERYPNDREAYLDGKAEFIRNVIEKAKTQH